MRLAYLNFLAHKLELSEGPLGIILVLQISKRDLVDAALETIGGNPCTSGPEKVYIDARLGNIEWFVMNCVRARLMFHLFTKVLPTWRTLKREGALMSYLRAIVDVK